MHYDKAKNGSEHARLMHNARGHARHRNKNIDPEKSRYNINLTARTNPNDTRTDMERFKDRLAQLTYRKQKNNVRLCEIVLTAPKNVPYKDMGNFFKASYRALQSLTGGSDNEVSAWVHMDEDLQHGRPHLHYCFVPGVEVNGVMKLSASKLVDRAFLQNLHPQVQAAIDQEFGHHNYLVVADDPADRQQTSDTLAAFKEKAARLENLDKQIQTATEDLQMVQDVIRDLGKEYKTIQHDLKAMADKVSATGDLLQSIHDCLSWDNYWQQIYDQAPSVYKRTADSVGSLQEKHREHWERSISGKAEEVEELLNEVAEVQHDLDDLEL